MRELADSTALQSDQAALRRRLAADGYLFFRRLLRPADVSAAYDSVRAELALGGWTDRALTWLIDLMLVVPSFLVIAILSPLYEGKTWLLYIVLIAAFGWMITGRMVRGMTISVASRDYVRAARYMGVSGRTIIVRHVLPNIASLLLIDAALGVNSAVMTETSLSFLGFGIQPPDVSLGTLLSSGQESATTQPWLFWFAAGLLVIFCLAVNMVGDGLRDAIDPTSGATR